MSLVKIALELQPNHAAALHQLCRKMGYTNALQFLQPHVSREIRSDQAYDIVHGCAALERALEEAHVNYWPWIETWTAAGVAP